MRAPNFQDLTGKQFGGLTVLSLAGFNERHQSFWLVTDVLGRQWTARSDKIKNARLRRSERHGKSYATEYAIWNGLRERCLNPNNPAFRNYGARGITVCSRWKDSFLNFYEDMGPRPAGLSIDRINNDGNYEPGNCRWATAAEQQANRRVSRKAA